MIVFGFDPQEALDAPRICLAADPASRHNSKYHGTPDGPVSNPVTVVAVEDTLSADVVEGLRALGHTVKVYSGNDRDIFGSKCKLPFFFTCRIQSSSNMFTRGPNYSAVN